MPAALDMRKGWLAGELPDARALTDQAAIEGRTGRRLKQPSTRFEDAELLAHLTPGPGMGKTANGCPAAGTRPARRPDKGPAAAPAGLTGPWGLAFPLHRGRHAKQEKGDAGHLDA